MKLDSAKKLLREDLPDAPKGEWLDILLQNIGQTTEQVTQALGGKLTNTDNTQSKYGAYRLTHGTTVTIKNPLHPLRPVGIVPRRTIAVPGSARPRIAYVDWEPTDNPDPKGPSLLKVTPYFDRDITGAVGEIVTANNFASAVTLVGSPAAAKTVTSLQLTAGDWDLSGLCWLSGTLTGTRFQCGFSTTANTLPASGNAQGPTMPTANTDISLALTPMQVSPTTTTTYYMVAKADFTVGTGTAYAQIQARRMSTVYSVTTPSADVVLFFDGG